MQARLSRMVGIVALHAHPNADPQSGNTLCNDLYREALSCVPYMGGAQSSGVSSADIEREEAIKRFRDWKKESK